MRGLRCSVVGLGTEVVHGASCCALELGPGVVDDPGDYGAIAATNALNDVFAMGGSPLLALSIAAFPEELPMQMLENLPVET